MNSMNSLVHGDPTFHPINLSSSHDDVHERGLSWGYEGERLGAPYDRHEVLRNEEETVSVRVSQRERV